MVIINPAASSAYNPVANSSVNATPRSSVSPGDEVKPDTYGSATDSGTFSSVSILAQQLSEAATRAETRIGQNDTSLLDSITGDQYLANKARHDAQVPSTDNPDLLARARQATGFVNGSDTNPFKGLTRDQLQLIAHDDGGPFTLNERRAAWEELRSMEPPAPAKSNSHRDLMISRLFGSNTEPPVAKPPFTRFNGTLNPNLFLNREDRALFADMYAYAQAQGVDLVYVDALAMTLGTYRHHSDGRQLLGGNTGYDAERYRVTFDFKPEDAAIASRVLNGSAINSTRIDQGFLRYILHPDHGAFMNIGGIPFLEKMVNKFSSEGDQQPPLGSEFATYTRVRIEDHIVRTTDKSIRLPPSEALSGIVNGVWGLTEKGKAAGYSIDPVTGRMSKPANAPDDQASPSSTLNAPVDTALNRNAFDTLADTRDQPNARWIWPGHLFKLMRGFKP